MKTLSKLKNVLLLVLIIGSFFYSCDTRNGKDSSVDTQLEKMEEEPKETKEAQIDNATVAKAFTDAQVNGDWKTYDNLSTDDFKLVGPGPEPMNKEQFKKFIKSLYDANSNFNNNVEVVSTSGDTLYAKVKMQGKHDKDWDMSFMNMGTVKATNIAWENPEEQMIIVMRDGKVAKLIVDIPEGGGIAGILEQIGVEMPKDN